MKNETPTAKSAGKKMRIPNKPIPTRKKKEKSHLRHKTPSETFKEAVAFFESNSRFPLHVRTCLDQAERQYEAKLAARITALYRSNRFSSEQKAWVPKHRPHTDENRLLNSLKNHIRMGHYTQEELERLGNYILVRNELYQYYTDGN